MKIETFCGETIYDLLDQAKSLGGEVEFDFNRIRVNENTSIEQLLIALSLAYKTGRKTINLCG